MHHKRKFVEEEELEEVGEEDAAEAGTAASRGEEDEVDPLDAFMEGIHEEVSRASSSKLQQDGQQQQKQRQEEEEEEEDPMETFLNARRDAGLVLAAEAFHAGYDSDEEVYAAARAVDKGSVDYDDEDNPIVTAERSKMETIPALDHSLVSYKPFSKDFYEQASSISGMSDSDVAEYRKLLGVKVSGMDVPRPVKSFEELGLDEALRGVISKQGYTQPTPIQCQALPVILSGRDIIGIAKTGSGKTAAFIIPMLVHIMDQEELGRNEGPIAVICAPTRELAQQIYTEAKKYSKPYAVRVSGIFGGLAKMDQIKELKAGVEVVVATPGRLVDILRSKVISMSRATYLVLDEADRMFEIGLEPQVMSIVGQIRPDRQTLLFSATMPFKVERLARQVLSDPVRVTVGEAGQANEDITQQVWILAMDSDKVEWLLSKLHDMVDAGDVLIFASTKVRVEELCKVLEGRGFRVAALHGDKEQAARMEVLQKFKSGQYHVLVATDVAARGLDIKSIKHVVNYDIAKDMDTHVHRVGRTGRAGDKEGVAHTLLTHKEARFAGELVISLVAAGQHVSEELMDLAMKDGRFRAKRHRRKGKGGGRGATHVDGGGGGRGGGGGGRGRGVRGVHYGMGIGYSAAAVAAPGSKNAACGSLKQGVMARFKSSFVPAAAATPAAPGAASGSRPPLPGFVAASSANNNINNSNNNVQQQPAQGRKAVIHGFVAASGGKSAAPPTAKQQRRSGWDR